LASIQVTMFFRLYFKNLSESKKIAYLRTNGSVVGERIRHGRKVIVYLVKDFFAEVVYKNDNPENELESLLTFPSIKDLNSYLERDFMAP
jgi:hypothetical protein